MEGSQRVVLMKVAVSRAAESQVFEEVGSATDSAAAVLANAAMANPFQETITLSSRAGRGRVCSRCWRSFIRAALRVA